MKPNLNCFSSAVIGLVALGAIAMGPKSALAQSGGDNELAVSPPVFLQLEMTSACTQDGALFEIINRGNKWPRTGFLRLYHADDRSLISQRRIRLGSGQKVSFVVKEKVSNGRPVGIWVEPEWYDREFEYDARLNCE